METLLLSVLLAVLPATTQQANLSAPPSLLASAVIAGLVSAIVSGGVSLLVKDKEYKNDYYKKVIDKRIKAIETVEALASLYNPIKYSAEGKAYQAIFCDDEFKEKVNEATIELGKVSIWLTINTLNTTRALNIIISLFSKIHSTNNEDEKRQWAVEHFESISEAVQAVKDGLRKEMASLYNIKKFFRKRSKHHKSTILPRQRE